jgi:hypothetical protein
MRAVNMLVAAGTAAASLATATPVTAQYYPPAYPGYPQSVPQAQQAPGYDDDRYGSNGYDRDDAPNTSDQRYAPNGYNQGYAPNGYNQGYAPNGYNQSYLTNMCANAAQARLNGNYGYRGYGYGRGRVLGISRVEPREGGRGWQVSGVAASGYSYNQGPDIVWSCRTDYRGAVVNVELRRGSNGYNYTPWGDNNSPYGYHRY